MPFAMELSSLFRRDLLRLLQEIEAFPEDLLWDVREGVTNPAGTLTLHLEGNLRHFVGFILGQVDYTRQRDLEFSIRGLSREVLLERIRPLPELVASVIASLSEESLESVYPLNVFGGTPLPTRQVLLSLYGHLSYHTGQIDYLRRVVSGNAAIELAGL